MKIGHNVKNGVPTNTILARTIGRARAWVDHSKINMVTISGRPAAKITTTNPYDGEMKERFVVWTEHQSITYPTPGHVYIGRSGWKPDSRNAKGKPEWAVEHPLTVFQTFKLENGVWKPSQESMMKQLQIVWNKQLYMAQVDQEETPVSPWLYRPKSAWILGFHIESSGQGEISLVHNRRDKILAEIEKWEKIEMLEMQGKTLRQQMQELA